MTWVNIPFRARNAALIEAGVKSCTSRHHIKGKTGDFFKVGLETYVLTKVEQHTLGWVAEYLYREEGFTAPEEFIAEWNAIASEMAEKWGDRSKFAPFEESSIIWTHHFIRLDEWEKKRPRWF
jgi:hypothetical protein